MGIVIGDRHRVVASLVDHQQHAFRSAAGQRARGPAEYEQRQQGASPMREVARIYLQAWKPTQCRCDHKHVSRTKGGMKGHATLLVRCPFKTEQELRTNYRLFRRWVQKPSPASRPLQASHVGTAPFYPTDLDMAASECLWNQSPVFDNMGGGNRRSECFPAAS